MFRTHLNLTGRILISFWGTLVIIIAFLATLLFFEKENSDFKKHVPQIKIHDQLIQKLLTEDYSEVATWFRQLPKKETRRIYIVNKQQEILNRSLPRLLNRIDRNLSTDRPFIHYKRFKHVAVGRIMHLPSGDQVRILIKGHKSPHYHILKDEWLSITLLAIFISGLISYLLARFLSRPILHLRQATQDIAAGDLSIRVAKQVNPRHGDIFLLAKDFDQMAQKLEKTISSHKHLIQDISHELRSPVARLQLALELAKKRLDIEDNQPDIARIEKECDNINAIINTLLNLPAYELEPQLGMQDCVDVSELVRSICEDVNFTNTQAKVQCQTPQKPPAPIMANQQLLRSAIENVVKNALHYHDNERPIEVNLKVENDRIVFTCCDLGPGIPNEQLEQIFKPFYRISEARERASGGFGLGLAITKRAIELHGGSVEANNRQDKGLCVTIHLPLNTQ